MASIGLHCIFVDSGLLRKGEYGEVLSSYEGMGLNVIAVDAHERFFADLAGVTDPESKRKRVGKAFVDVFDSEARRNYRGRPEPSSLCKDGR